MEHDLFDLMAVIYQAVIVGVYGNAQRLVPFQDFVSGFFGTKFATKYDRLESTV